MKQLLVTGLLVLPMLSYAGPTKVGNGDDGADLEKLQKVESGMLISTRDKALELLKSTNVRSVKGLGTVEQELKQAEIFIAQTDIAVPKKFDNGLEASQDGKQVYARTIAQPYSPVRFFPAAMMLSEEQLVRLHIHEALHRALPESIREDESAVSDITLAITSPTANRDSIEIVTAKYVAPAAPRSFQPTGEMAITMAQPTDRLKNPSTLRYSYTAFKVKADDLQFEPITGMHRFDSYLHPFGGPTDSLGLGLSFSYLNTDTRNYMGPLQISGRQLVSTWRGFDVEAWGEVGLYTLSNEELKNMEMARDTGTLGLSIRKEDVHFYTENFISLTLPTKKDFKIGNVGYVAEYSSIVTAKVGAGTRLKKFSAGANLEMSLTDGKTISADSGSFESEKERIRLVMFGPELGYVDGGLHVNVYAKAVIDGTPGYNISDMADLMGQGAGQSYVGASVAYQF